MVDYIPERGCFIYFNFDPQSGYEQKGKRPALIMSHTKFNRKMGFVLVCPISNTQRRNPFYVQILEGEPVTGVIMADQLRSLDYRARGAAFISECPQELFAEVLRRISPILF